MSNNFIESCFLENSFIIYLKNKQLCCTINNIYFWPRLIFVYQKSLKRTFKTRFWEQHHLLNLYFSAVNSLRLRCVQKACEKCSYESFLVYKIILDSSSLYLSRKSIFIMHEGMNEYIFCINVMNYNYNYFSFLGFW